MTPVIVMSIGCGLVLVLALVWLYCRYSERSERRNSADLSEAQRLDGPEGAEARGRAIAEAQRRAGPPGLRVRLGRRVELDVGTSDTPENSGTSGSPGSAASPGPVEHDGTGG